MRLVAAPDGAVDRQDRALWLTGGFDLAWLSAVGKAPGYAQSPVAGRLGGLVLAGGVQAGVLQRSALAQGAVGAASAPRRPAGVEVGLTGRGAPAGAVVLGVRERERLAAGVEVGSY